MNSLAHLRTKRKRVPSFSFKLFLYVHILHSALLEAYPALPGKNIKRGHIMIKHKETLAALCLGPFGVSFTGRAVHYSCALLYFALLSLAKPKEIS